MPVYSDFSCRLLLDRVRQVIPARIPVYLVGGALRDEILGRPVHDLDFVLAAEALKVSRLVADRLGAAFYPLDTERDAGRCILIQPDDSRFILDFTSQRGPDLESDLRLRDFTVNAMALDLHRPGSIIDPLGGLQDLHDRRLRACSPAALRDDPLRILRGVRQAVAFHLQIEPDTRQWLKEAAALLVTVSPERLRDEVFRILGGARPGTALRILDILGAIDAIMPELVGLKQTTQSAPHTLDVWEHTLAALDRLEQVIDLLAPEADLAVGANWTLGLVSLRLGRYRQQIAAHFADRLNSDRSLRSLLFCAALFHDAGKPSTRQVDAAERVRFFKHDEVSRRLAEHWARRLHLSNAEIDRLVAIVGGHMRPNLFTHTGELPTRRATYRFFREYGVGGVDICLLSLADTLATYGATLPRDTWIFHLDVVRELLAAWWEHPEDSVTPPVILNGRDLLREFGLKEGPQIGQLLEAVREAQAGGAIKDRVDAIAFVRAQLGHEAKDKFRQE